MKSHQLLLFNFMFLLFTSSAQLTPTFDDIMIPMRDGLSLEADIYIPSGVDSAEVILIQTPYNKDLLSWSLPMGVQQNLDGQPFIWVIVDWRGFYGSFGALIPQPNRGEDGYDVCEWIKDQIWFKDRIGTWGPSALGGVQYYLAREQHPNHTCAVPMVATAHQSYDSYFTNGVLEKARLEQLDALGYGLSPIVLANPYDNITWQFAASTTWFPSDIHIPTLQIGGWYDHNIDLMMDFYEDARNTADITVQDEQWLLVGPWVHGGTGAANVGTSIQGELTYPNAEFVSDTMAWDFLNYYLLDAPNNWQNTDKITYYEPGIDAWNSSNAASIESLTNDVLYFNDGGALSPSLGSGSTTLVSDSQNPSPTIGGATLHSTLDQGPYDQSSLEGRNDILVFSTATLGQEVTISGRVGLNLEIEADQEDCDVSIRLIDEYPDGRNMLITDGIARMRFRNGYEQTDEAFMVTGTVYNRQFDLPFTNYTWLAGHKIKVLVGGNSSYRWDVNLQNGGPMYTAGDTNIANISLHHSTTNTSSITLPGDNPHLGTNELSTIAMNIYPNPVQDELIVDSKVVFTHVEVIDLSGRVLISMSKFEGTLNTQSLNSGVYLLRVSDGESWTEKRFVKF
ncbi:MAG: CocE/NonD family hydrolase [Crocinitomicaceae bacterium]|nr:CocE/NonD family hydrolase [Crocinitomicaceae bacterium]